MEQVLGISELSEHKDLFKFVYRKDNVEHYEPLKNITIQSINLETGEVSWNKIVDYTVHYDLIMYSIIDPLERFERFWASSDHSMVAFDEDKQTLIKISPFEILKNVEKYSLVIWRNDDYLVIPYSELIIDLDTSKTVGYDFTVENDYTFALYDGVFVQDTAALFMPMTLEAQNDCRNMNVPTGMTNTTQVSLEVKHELVLAAYIITDQHHPRTPDLGIMTYKDLRADLFMGLRNDCHCHQTLTLKLPNGKAVKTTLGRALFNAVFPDEFLKDRYDWFLDKQIDKKVMNGNIIYGLFQYYTHETAGDVVSKIIEFTSKYTSAYPASLLLSEFMNTKMFESIKKKYIEAKTMDEKQKYIDEIEKKMKTDLTDELPMINYIVASGSRGDPSQLRQMLVTKGIVQDAQGNFLSVNEGYCEGMAPESVFIDGYGSRKGIMDRSRSTAVTGYLTRKLIYACASVVLDTNLRDCGTKRTVPVKITKANASLLYGRYFYDKNGNKVLLSQSNEEKYYDQDVELRSPIFCKSKKLCKTCYGECDKFYGTPFVGILAGHALGERGTQEIMKTFHTAGAATIIIPDLIQQALNNNPNLRRDEMKKYFVQEKTKLKFNTNQSVEIVLRFDEYLNLGMTEFTLDPEKSHIISDVTVENTDVSRVLALKPFACHVKFGDGAEFEIIMDDKIYIPYEYFECSEGKNTEGVKCITLKADEVTKIPFFMNVDVTSTDLNLVMQTVLSIIEKKNIMKYPEVAFNKLTKIYGGFKVAYNHIEILISQIFRNKQKPEYPARLIEPYVAQVHGIKEIAHLEGFLTGMLFENMGKSLQNGWINDTVTHSPIEQLLSNDFDFLKENSDE